MPKETMSPRERWLAVLNRRKPDRVPMDYQATDEFSAKLRKHLSCFTMDEVFKKLSIDRPVTVAPKYVGPAQDPNTDVFGLKYRDVNYGTGSYRECTNHPLAGFQTVAEIEKGYRWPSPDWWDHSVIPGQLKGKEHLPVRGGGSEPFLLYKNLRGDEQAFMDLIENPELLHYCLDKLFGLAYETTRRIYETVPGQVTHSYVAEDLGAQEDLMYSPDQIRTFLLPRMKRMIDLAHQAGVKVIHHDDGAIRKILPDLIAIGIDVLDPIQWRCRGMEREGLKKDFGSKLIFHGAVDNQQTLPFGTVKDVHQEVVENLRILGAGGGYILGPCHNIQAVSPPENIVALYETGLANGWT